MSLLRMIGRIPMVGPLARRVYRAVIPAPPFTSSAHYWEHRYQTGGNSGLGSVDRLATFKSAVVNDFVSKAGVGSIIEFGCGDGGQLTLASYPAYLGVDVSEAAIHQCRARFVNDRSKTFLRLSEYAGSRADLALSLDVIYHLVEDDVFQHYMHQLFKAAEQYVIIYSSNEDMTMNPRDPHIRHRQFSVWIEQHMPQWELIESIRNPYPASDNPFEGSFADFHIYGRIATDRAIPASA